MQAVRSCDGRQRQGSNTRRAVARWGALSTRACFIPRYPTARSPCPSALWLHDGWLCDRQSYQAAVKDQCIKTLALPTITDTDCFLQKTHNIMLKILPLFVVVVISRVEAYHEHDQRPIAATDDNIHSPRRASVHIRVRAIYLTTKA